MSYVRKTRSGPELGVGGFSTSETMMSGGKRGSKRKSAKTKRAKPKKVKNYGGLKVKKHSFGPGPGITRGKNRPKY